jgi:hypothetical protein
MPSSPRDLGERKKTVNCETNEKKEICSTFGSEKGTVASGIGIFIFWIEILLLDSHFKK